MAGRHHDHQVVRAIGKGLQAAGIDRFGKQTDIQMPVGHVLDDGGADAFRQINADFRIVLEEGREFFRQELRHAGRIGGDPHMAAHAGAEFAEFGLHPVGQT